MNKIEKLLIKINEKDRERLLKVLEYLIQGKKEKLDVKKIKNTDFYRSRNGRFRIIFHYENKEVVVDSIKLRNRKTYKRF